MMGSDSIVTWGYAKGFVIEYDDTLKKRIDCKSCLYFEKSDKTCLKKQVYLPVDGLDSWKNCNCFSLDKGTANYEIKKAALDKKRKTEIDYYMSKPKSQRPYNYKKNDRVFLLKGGFSLIRKSIKNTEGKLRSVRLEITNSKGEVKHISLLCDFDDKVAYFAGCFTNEVADIIGGMIE